MHKFIVALTSEFTFGSRDNGMFDCGPYCTFDLKSLVVHRKNINDISMRYKTPSLAKMSGSVLGLLFVAPILAEL